MSAASAMPSPTGAAAPLPELAQARTWIVTDGKAGDENQCLGLAETLGLPFEIRRIAPRPPFGWMAPWGPIDPRDQPGSAARRPGRPPPRPADRVGAPRRPVSPRRARGVRGPHLHGLPQGPAHRARQRRLRLGPGLRRPARPQRLHHPDAAASGHAGAPRRRPAPSRTRASPALPRPRVAVLVGGDSRHLQLRPADMRRLLRDLDKLADGGCSLMVTVSRRTPQNLRDALRTWWRRKGGFLLGRQRRQSLCSRCWRSPIRSSSRRIRPTWSARP